MPCRLTSKLAIRPDIQRALPVSTRRRIPPIVPQGTFALRAATGGYVPKNRYPHSGSEAKLLVIS